MLDVKRLKVLREVAAHGSFSAAAEALAYTQSAVSQQIATLEREAGTVLVDRSARGVSLTDAGEALVRHADAILARLAEAEAELEAIAGLRGGRLRIVAFPTAGATLAPRAIAAFRERHPAVDLTLIPGEPEDGIAALKSGETDIALLIESGFETWHDEAIERTPRDGRPDVRPAARGAPARGAPRGCVSRTFATTRGSWARPAAPARMRRSCCGPASRRASSRGSSSTATTTWRSRASSPPAWASR